MKYTHHPASERGHADHGWLNSHHSFSFANYYNPDRMNFGVLRVFNDDVVAAGQGFGTHPHSNMEIISIPTYGALEHRDSMNNRAVIKRGDVQVMSAGTGIAHSEFNHSATEEVRFFQIWLFPKVQGVEPRYDQISLDDLDPKNRLQQVLSPNPDDAGVWIHQDAWFFMGDFDRNMKVTHQSKRKGNGAYLFVIEGRARVGDYNLGRRDALGVEDYEQVDIEVEAGTQLLLLDVPMEISA